MPQALCCFARVVPQPTWLRPVPQARNMPSCSSRCGDDGASDWWAIRLGHRLARERSFDRCFQVATSMPAAAPCPIASITVIDAAAVHLAHSSGVDNSNTAASGVTVACASATAKLLARLGQIAPGNSRTPSCVAPQSSHRRSGWDRPTRHATPLSRTRDRAA